MGSKKLFLITGMMRSVNNWQIPIEQFTKDLEGYDIIALDVAGMGIHFHKKSPLSLKSNVEFLRSEYEKHKGETNILLGFSLGGMIVTTWSQLYPKEMDGLIIVTSSFGGFQPFWKRLKPSVLPYAVMAFYTKGQTREKYMFKMIAKNKANKERLMHQWEQEQNLRPIKNINIIRQAIAGWAFNAKKMERKHPTLVIAAKNDQLVDYSCSEKIRDHWDADFVCHNESGHDVLNDDPKWVTGQIKKWIYDKKLI